MYSYNEFLIKFIDDVNTMSYIGSNVDFLNIISIFILRKNLVTVKK